jgi:hypothetical protein
MHARERGLVKWLWSSSQNKLKHQHIQRQAVCFFVLCNRHWFNRVLGIACLPVHPCSDAGYVDLPLTLLGAPGERGEAAACHENKDE